MNMKKSTIVPACIIAAGFFGATNLTQASNINCWESSFSGSPLDFLNEKWCSHDNSYDLSYSNTWNILSDGFNPGTDTIDAITVWFSFADDSKTDGEEYVDISLGGTNLWDDLEVDGMHPATNYATYSMVLDPLTHFSVFQDLAADGKLGFSVVLQELVSDCGSKSKNLEDTYVKVAKIQACSSSTPIENPVPDSGSTFLAFGIGLLGLGGVRRFLIKA